MEKLTKIHTWWLARALPWRRWRVVGHVVAGDEVPEELPYRGVVLVGTTHRPIWAALDCPCRSGHRLMVNLDEKRNPHWRIPSQRPLTLWPSIDFIDHGRRCHFVLNKGAVRWAQDTREVTT